MVNDFNDYCQTSRVQPMGEEHNSADLDLPPLSGFDLDVCHTKSTIAVLANLAIGGRDVILLTVLKML